MAEIVPMLRYSMAYSASSVLSPMQRDLANLVDAYPTPVGLTTASHAVKETINRWQSLTEKYPLGERMMISNTNSPNSNRSNNNNNIASGTAGYPKLLGGGGASSSYEILDDEITSF